MQPKIVVKKKNKMIVVYLLMLAITIIISVLWAIGIDKNKDIKSDDVEFP